MRGITFEKEFCKLLSKIGFWVLNIPKSESGAQPFDVIAVNDKYVRCYDCKVLTNRNGRFPLARIEDNQWLAFESFEKKTKRDSSCALAILYDSDIYIIKNYMLKKAADEGLKSIDLKIIKPYFDSMQIEKIMGYKLL